MNCTNKCNASVTAGRARTPCAPRRAEDCPPYLFPPSLTQYLFGLLAFAIRFFCLLVFFRFFRLLRFVVFFRLGGARLLFGTGAGLGGFRGGGFIGAGG